jgi:hypothetical protein
MGHAAHAHPHTALATPHGYQRRRPEKTALYQAIAEHFPAFLERAEQAGGLPRFVIREFEEYLRCGRLDRGCLHLVCRQCGYSQLVAFSCKGRAFCPSCLGRKMVDSAVHLEQDVLPEVPIRHWICSFPWGLRALLGYDKKLCSKVCAAFMTELGRSLRRRAKRLLGLRSVADAHTGAVVAVQRTDSALRLNVHLHALVLDGVYLRDDHGILVFHALPTPTRAEVADVARRSAERVERVLRAAGRSLDPSDADDSPPELALEEPGLAACYGAAAQGVAISGDRAGQPTLRLVVQPSTQPPTNTDTDLPDEPVAEVRGINVYAKQLVDGRDRRRVERLARYITRPPVAQDRLTLRPDGRLELAFKTVWKDGTRALVLEPHDLISRLVAAVPPPRFHTLRYFGVLSSHASLRSEVVPQREMAKHDASIAPPPAAGDQLDLELDSADDDDAPRPTRKRWAWLLTHVFQADLDHCPQCAGPMRWADVATTEDAAARLMAKHGLAPQPPPPPRMNLSPIAQLELPLS